MDKIRDLCTEYDRLHVKYGGRGLEPIYFGGKSEEPEMCFVFMNPTSRNIAAAAGWAGVRAPWIGTKNIWKLFYKLALLDGELYNDIQRRKPNEWDEEFAERVYGEVERRGYFVTNLAKCTQPDARALHNRVFCEYLPIFEREMALVRPKKIVTFGNQVSSIFLGKKIEVSKCRGVSFEKIIDGETYSVWPTYYPVGQGMRNMGLVVEDIIKIMET